MSKAKKMESVAGSTPEPKEAKPVRKINVFIDGNPKPWTVVEATDGLNCRKLHLQLAEQFAVDGEKHTIVCVWADNGYAPKEKPAKEEKAPAVAEPAAA